MGRIDDVVTRGLSRSEKDEMLSNERLRSRLHMKDGRTLDKHPVLVYYRSCLTVGAPVIDDDSVWHSEGAIKALTRRITFPGLFVDIAAIILELEEIAALLRDVSAEVDATF